MTLLKRHHSTWRFVITWPTKFVISMEIRPFSTFFDVNTTSIDLKYCWMMSIFVNYFRFLLYWERKASFDVKWHQLTFFTSIVILASSLTSKYDVNLCMTLPLLYFSSNVFLWIKEKISFDVLNKFLKSFDALKYLSFYFLEKIRFSL